MWYEDKEIDHVRRLLSLPQAPLWISASAIGQLLGGARPPRRGSFFVFHCLVAFCSFEDDDDFVYRASFNGLDLAVDDLTRTLRLVLNNVTFKLSMCEELDAITKAVMWITTNPGVQCNISERAEIMFPEATAKIQTLAKRLKHPEYVVQELKGAIVTSHRLFFATSVVSLQDVEMMHMFGDELKIIINRTLVLHLRCSQQQQNLIASVWLAVIPIDSQFVAGSEKDPQTALKSHVRVLQQLHRQFCAIDESGDGMLQMREVENTIGFLFRSRDFIPGFFRAMDENNDGAMSLQEFVVGMCGLFLSDFSSRLSFALRIFDHDKDGNVSTEEFTLALELLAATGEMKSTRGRDLHRSVETVLRLLDPSCTGALSITSFLEAWKSEKTLRHVICAVLSDSTPQIPLFGDCMSVANKDWFVMAAVIQVLNVGLGAPTDLHKHPNISKKDFTDDFSARANIDESIIHLFGHTSNESNDYGCVVAHAPRVFEKLRSFFGLNLRFLIMNLGADRILSRMLIGSEDGLIPRNSAPGTLEFVSRDQNFVVRSMSVEEKSHLILTLPQYVAYLMSCPSTLLPRCIGIFTAKCNAAQLHLGLFLNVGRPMKPPKATVVLQPVESGHMKNDAMHASDLKGKVELARGWHESIVKQIKKDVGFLTQNSFVGYSLHLQLFRLPKAPSTTFFTPEFLRDALRQSQRGPVRGGCCKRPAVKGQTNSVRLQLAASQAQRESVPPSKTSLSDSFMQSRAHLALYGGMFFQFQGGCPGAAGEPVIISFLRPFSAQSPTGSSGYGEALLKVVERCVSGEDDIKIVSSNAACASIRQYDVSTETGKLARVGVDERHQQLIVAGPGGESLLVLSLVLDGQTLSFVRDFPAFTDISKRLITIRSGMRRSNKGRTDFDSSISLAFESYPAREAFLAEVHQVVASDGKQGMHVFESQILLVVWDMGDALPGDMDPLFEGVDDVSDDGSRIDIVCVSVQHCSYATSETTVASCEGDWVDRVARSLTHFDKVSCASMWSNRLAIFVRHSLLHQVSNIATTKTSSVVGNRGAVATQMMFFDTSLLFVGAEFAARYDGGNSNQDFFDTCEGLQHLGQSDVCVLQMKHHIFFLGDLKYRVARSFKDTVALLGKGDISAVAARDELTFERNKQKVFCGFFEPPLTFPPTGRYELAGEIAKPRVYANQSVAPHWSSRILHKSLGHSLDEAKCLAYSANSSVPFSECAPVSARYSFTARQQYVCRTSTTAPVIALIISRVVCREVSRTRAFEGETNYVRMHCPLFVQSAARTQIIPSARDLAWNDLMEIPVHPCEPGLLTSNYITFVILDDDSSNGNPESLGAAVAPLTVISEKAQTLTVPIMHHGSCRGHLSVQVSLKVGA
jgi:Ca2+-binding EF-hand superfamily protein